MESGRNESCHVQDKELSVRIFQDNEETSQNMRNKFQLRKTVMLWSDWHPINVKTVLIIKF